eukprot:CAMPEP_0174734202 /NCGR_PEP_ID=MMETSP1094-20130205/62822_1 /TAXON_ID=156173 /ORGANISM="Chrysochromulina brevifilum, Strain UTEX LB 985" /LENGTH=173 /DNA_ID=CAMNT_0015936987 /DNA_START=27 /DNA_END=548 /DNA_ORIENTATION=+
MSMAHLQRTYWRRSGLDDHGSRSPWEPQAHRPFGTIGSGVGHGGPPFLHSLGYTQVLSSLQAERPITGSLQSRCFTSRSDPFLLWKAPPDMRAPSELDKTTYLQQHENARHGPTADFHSLSISKQEEAILKRVMAERGVTTPLMAARSAASLRAGVPPQLPPIRAKTGFQGTR